MTELNYEPRVILEHADRLNRRADSMGVTSAIIGAVIGGFFGAVPLTSLGDSWPIPSQFGFGTLLVGLLLGALVGYVIGDARGFGYRLQAQSSLCQLQLERNTAALVAAATPDVRYVQPEPARPRFEYTEPDPEPEPEPMPYIELPLDEYFQPEPEPATFVEAVPLAEVPTPFVFAMPEPELEPEPEPAPLAEAPPPPRLAEAPLPDLDSMSLEEIARLAKSGLI